MGLLVGFSRIESIKQRLMIFVAWNPDVVGISTMRWLMGQTVAVEDVLKEAERHFPRAKEFYKIKCRHEIKNKNE